MICDIHTDPSADCFLLHPSQQITHATPEAGIQRHACVSAVTALKSRFGQAMCDGVIQYSREGPYQYFDLLGRNSPAWYQSS